MIAHAATSRARFLVHGAAVVLLLALLQLQMVRNYAKE